MEYLENNKIKNEVIKYLINKLENKSGLTEYGCDLAYKLLERENINGKIFYNSNIATKWVQNNFGNLYEILEEIKFQYGSEYLSNIVLNVFENTDTFITCIYIEVASYVLGQCEFLQDNWNEEITLTEENINIIKEQLEEQID